MNSNQMLLTIQSIKKYWVYAFFIFAVALSVYTFCWKKETDTTAIATVKTFHTSIGWGYDVYAHGSIYIHQEYIPAMEGRRGFVSEAQAQRAGELVVSKMKGKGLPVVTKEEIAEIVTAE